PNPFTSRRLAIALVHRIDTVEDFTIDRRAQKLEILGMRPHQRHCRSSRLADAKTKTGPVWFIPYLLRHHLAGGSKFFVGSQKRLNIVARCEFIVGPLARQ